MSPFTYELFIPFQLADPAGILFFGHVFTLAHQAFEQFVCQSLKMPWQAWFQNSEWVTPIVHTEADYRKPLAVGKLCTIRLDLEEIKESSFTLAYQFDQEQQTCCSVKTVHVFCNQATGKKQSIPVEIRALLIKQFNLQPSLQN